MSIVIENPMTTSSVHDVIQVIKMAFDLHCKFYLKIMISGHDECCIYSEYLKNMNIVNDYLTIQYYTSLISYEVRIPCSSIKKIVCDFRNSESD